MPNREENRTALDEVLGVLTDTGFEGMASAMELLINEAMRLERSEFLAAAPYERSERRRGHANGYKPKSVKTRVGELGLRVPQVRGVEGDGESFYPKSLERGVRSERALKLAVAEMYVQGVSTRKVAEVTQKLCGLEISSSQVSRAAAALDQELEAWRTRPLGRCPYLIVDARYENVRHGGSVVSCAVLVATGILENGKRCVLGVSVALTEAEVHWRKFFSSLIDRGLHGVQLVVSDDHAGLRAARKACFTGVPWQRCQVHLQRNATSYVPRISMRKDVASALRAVFNAPDRSEAERLLKKTVDEYRDKAPKLADWMADNVPDSLGVFCVPPDHRRRLRTTNCAERLNREIKRRTRVATLFPNEASVLRLVSAVLAEISEDWETGRVYLNMEGC